MEHVPKIPMATDTTQPAADNPAWAAHAAQYRAEGLVNEDLFQTLLLLSSIQRISHASVLFDTTKGAFDRVAALVLIILLSPIFLVAALAIMVSTGGPVFFCQTRSGKFAAPFKIYKFRTMVPASERQIAFVQNHARNGLFKNPADPRITRVGRVLRRLSIDELPQLFNVLIGDMSLIGPRPLPESDSSTVMPEHYLRFVVKPGITGLWQVYARGEPDGRVKLALDCEYVRRRGVLFDLKLLLITIPRVLSGRGAY